jgi:hypothetical protein
MEAKMSLSVTADNVAQLALGVWEFEMPPHQIRFFGDCRRAEGARSVLLLSGAQYNAASKSLRFDAEQAVPLNVGTSNRALAISTDTAANRPASAQTAAKPENYGPGDREFLSLVEQLPPEGFRAAKILLQEIRSKFPGDLKRGLQRNFSNTPDNFWYVIVQPRSGGLSVTVRGEPERFGKSTLELKPDRPGYTRFKIVTPNDIAEATKIIFASKRRD